jgi:D-alanyl-D-alanine carboxypeptidase (penicillin-binding protein 5/6)
LVALAGGLGLFVALLAVWCRPDGSPASKAVTSGASADATAPAAAADCSTQDPCTPANAAISYGSDTPPPRIRGKAANVIEASCGEELYAKNADVELPPASLTKMMTALVAVQRASMDQLFTVKVNSALMVASTGSTVMGLEPGMELSLRDLLYGMLLPSGNDAAEEIALNISGSEAAFVDLMNRQAESMDLEHTRFANPHGLDQPGLHTSARDAALIGRAVLDDPRLAAIVRTKIYQPRWGGPEVANGNELLEHYPGTIGVKTGYTEKAGQTLVAAAQREGRTLIVSILGSWDRYSDASSLFDWAFASTTEACDALG